VYFAYPSQVVDGMLVTFVGNFKCAEVKEFKDIKIKSFKLETAKNQNKCSPEFRAWLGKNNTHLDGAGAGDLEFRIGKDYGAAKFRHDATVYSVDGKSNYVV
jgi:hypothetical protein